MVDWAGLISWAIVFHLFGVIIWIGNLLVIATMLSLATAFCGIILILLDPAVLMVGWLHTKLVLVLVLLYFHYRLYRRILNLENDPSGASAREFKMIHGLVSALLLAILALAVLKPF